MRQERDFNGGAALCSPFDGTAEWTDFVGRCEVQELLDPAAPLLAKALSLLLPQVLRISSIGDAYGNIGRQLKDGHWVSFEGNAMTQELAHSHC